MQKRKLEQAIDIMYINDNKEVQPNPKSRLRRPGAMSEKAQGKRRLIGSRDLES